MNITIIGSFKKFYSEICNIILLFERAGMQVLSPKNSKIIKNIDGFVILKTDKINYEPYQIQEEVFNNIEKSDLVYVWNPEGYIGKSTCYEIGKITEKEIPIFFKEMPLDLPLKIENDNIKEPNELILYCKKYQEKIEWCRFVKPHVTPSIK